MSSPNSTTLPVSQINAFKQELKAFTESKQAANDFIKMLMSYEEARNKGVKVTDIVKIVEEVTKTEVPDNFDEN